MLWIKALHIIFMVTWFAALFYLPRLFVYHSMSNDSTSIDRFKIMERKLYYGIMMPGMVLTVGFGLWLLISGWSVYVSFGWIYVKLALVILLLMYHFWCGSLVKKFKHDRITKSHIWFRWFNEVPVLFLVLIVLLAVVRPF
jgi:putative membrane protein